MGKKNGLQNLIYNANNKGNLLYFNYIASKNLDLLCRELVSNFTKNFEHKEVKEYLKFLKMYFEKLGKPYQSISFRLPDLCMQNSLVCFDGIYAYTKSCDACNKYLECNKRLYFMYVVKRVVYKLNEYYIDKRTKGENFV